MIDRNLKKRLLTSIILFTVLALLLNYNFVLIYCIILFGTISILEFTNLLKKIDLNIVLKFFYASIFVVYILYFSLLIFYNLNHGIEIKVITAFILLICIFSDIGGLIFGKTFKGPKLTSISPNKTISGSIGSIISSLIIFFIFVNLYDYGIPLYKLFILTVSISFLSQAGDILFSYMKRKARVKDTGNLLPGHGGVLDRIDGILIGLPIGNELFYFLI
tara:strand:+ start:2792 stop:3448 length:657 start_codon:yes stop_codon:yes gene_type:complete